ncbi:MAG: ribulose-phosphate 3-epimerase [Planctomycetota bacterium]
MLDLTAAPARPLVSASVLSADFGAMAGDCHDVLERGADLLHIDVMDGHFVGNLSMGPDMVRGIRKHAPEVLMDVHLMVDRPDLYVEPFADAGANHLTFHLEVCDPVRARHVDADALIQRIHTAGMTAGMAINPFTAPDGLAPYLDRLAMALVMSVHPGKSGQKFLPFVLDKTRWLHEHTGPGTRIEMDGGVGPTTCDDAAAAGCDVMVTASALFGSNDRSAVIDRLHAAKLPA